MQDTDPNGPYASFHHRSIDERDAFWAEQARLIDWQTPPQRICDYDRPPFARWFAGGTTNLCHNAVDRHLAARADRPALIAVSTETGTERSYTFAELHAEVQRMAAALPALGALHSVVFGGFAPASLASRIDDAEPEVIVSADAGSRGGRVIPYKPLLDEALRLATRPPAHVLLADGATGRPKGVQRDTGGYTVALAARMRHIFDAQPGQTFFCTSDIGWVMGHSYLVHGPLIGGMATLLYEGLPVVPAALRAAATEGPQGPGADIWWRLVEKYRVTHMFSALTAIRVLRKHDPAWLGQHDLSSLQGLWLAGEPLDAPTAQWVQDVLQVPVVDNYWQTESGWQILTVANGVHRTPPRLGSPGFAMYGYDLKLVDESTGVVTTAPGQKGVVAIDGPLPPGCMQTVWRDDARFVTTYWRSLPGPERYSTFDRDMRDAHGYLFILGRTDDVINVAGYRLDTREIEEIVSGHPGIAEVAVVGVADTSKGQAAWALAVPRDPAAATDAGVAAKLEAEVMARVTAQLGAPARPGAVRGAAAQDPQRQAAAPGDPARLRGPGPGRSEHVGRPGRTPAGARCGGGLIQRAAARQLRSAPPATTAADL